MFEVERTYARYPHYSGSYGRGSLCHYGCVDGQTETDGYFGFHHAGHGHRSCRRIVAGYAVVRSGNLGLGDQLCNHLLWGGGADILFRPFGIIALPGHPVAQCGRLGVVCCPRCTDGSDG